MFYSAEITGTECALGQPLKLVCQGTQALGMHPSEQGQVFPGSRLLSLGTDTSHRGTGEFLCGRYWVWGSGVHLKPDGKTGIWS